MRWFHIHEVAELDAGIFGRDAWSEEFFWSQMAAPGASFFVVLDGVSDDAPVLGFAGLAVSGPQAEVLTIASHPEARGRGIGRTLLAHLIAEARVAGCEVVHLDVRADNEAALGLYASFGFTELGRRAGYYDGCDAVLMRAFL